MKILFLQLSDIHLKDSDFICDLKIKKIVSALESIKFTKCVLIISGDLVNSGTVNEFKKIKTIIGKLILEIKRKYVFINFINVIVIPGNHDANFNNIKRNIDDIQQYYKSGQIKTHVEEELNMFKNFFTFSNLNNCFKEDKILDRKIINFNGYKIQFNLINTALFSTLKPDDKQVHYFPEELLTNIYKDENVDIAITIMHHSTEWFNSKSKDCLEKAIYRDSSILFLGHDHIPKTNNLEVDNKENIFIIAGGIFSAKDITTNSEFNILVLDTDNNCIDTYRCTWKYPERIYYVSPTYKDRKLFIRKTEFIPNNEFITYIKEDAKRKITEKNNFLEYFVFPDLKKKVRLGSEEEVEDEFEIIDDNNKFINELNKHKFINIIGEESSGKTTVLKYIYLALINNKIPLFFSNDNISGKNKKVIKRVFEEQYSDEEIDYKMYEQIEKNKKIAIIDDFDLIKDGKSKNDFINTIKENFEYIIIATKGENKYNIVEEVRSEINKNEEFLTLKIQEFYLRKRKKLVKKVCKSLRDIDEKEINSINNIINTCIQNDIGLFDLNPEFIIQYTQFFMENMNYKSKKADKFLNNVFITNISNAIIANSKVEDLEEIRILLEEIAYYGHFNKKEPLLLSDIEAVIKEYNENFGCSIKPFTLIEIACKAKILKRESDTFAVRFTNRNQLAFFVAKALIRKFNIDNQLDHIEYVLKNICFGINDNIILFISYISDNPRIIKSIYRYASELISSWEEIDIKNSNIKYLSKVKDLKDDVEAPKSEDKEKQVENQEKYEQTYKEEQNIECINLYDYNEEEVDDPTYKIIKAIKYIEMICKSLPSLTSIIPITEKRKLVEAIYRYPNKIIYYLLKPIDDNYEELIDEFFKLSNELDNEDGLNRKYAREDIEVFFKKLTISLILGLYDKCAYFSTSKRSIQFLNEFTLSNVNYEIFNLLVEIKNKDIDQVIKKAEKIYDDNNNRNIKIMIKLIIKKFLIDYDNIEFSKQQKIVNKFFGTDEKKVLLLQQGRKILSK